MTIMSMMPDQIFVKLKRSLTLHEDRQKFPYIDTLGNLTIGIGYNLSARGISDEWIDKQFSEDVSYFYDKLMEDFSWFKELNDDRQIVLCDMAFMGYKKFCEFTKMLTALSDHAYAEAAWEMLNSDWAHQVKGRAQILSDAMLMGVYNV